MMKVTVEFDNGATVTYHGADAEEMVAQLCLSESDYEPGEAVDISTQDLPFLPKEDDDEQK